MFSFSLNVLCLKKEHLWRLCTHQLCFLQHQSSCLHRIITQVRLKFTKLYINYLIYISSRKYSVLHHEWVLTKDPLVDGENFMFNSYLDASYYFRYRFLHRTWVLLLERLYRKVIVLMQKFFHVRLPHNTIQSSPSFVILWFLFGLFISLHLINLLFESC